MRCPDIVTNQNLGCNTSQCLCRSELRVSARHGPCGILRAFSGKASSFHFKRGSLSNCQRPHWPLSHRKAIGNCAAYRTAQSNNTEHWNRLEFPPLAEPDRRVVHWMFRLATEILDIDSLSTAGHRTCEVRTADKIGTAFRSGTEPNAGKSLELEKRGSLKRIVLLFQFLQAGTVNCLTRRRRRGPFRLRSTSPAASG